MIEAGDFKIMAMTTREEAFETDLRTSADFPEEYFSDLSWAVLRRKAKFHGVELKPGTLIAWRVRKEYDLEYVEGSDDDND